MSETSERRRYHNIKAMPWPEIHCACGWAYRLPKDESWGSIGGHDHMLDMHALHAAGMNQQGK